MAKTEKKKDNKKRLLLLIVLLVLTLILVTTSTYAWFISNKTVSIDSLDVQARTANGLEISADALNWGVSINKGNLIENAWDEHENQLPDILDHVSSVGTIYTRTDGKNYVEMFDGNVEISCIGDTNDDGSCAGTETYTLKTTKSTEVNCYDSNGTQTVPDSKKCNGQTFVAFDIFLKVTNDANLFLGTNSGVKRNLTENTDYGIQNATRVAFLYRGHLATADYYTENAEDGVLAARNLNAGTTGDDAASVVIWEPNAGSHTATGVAAARQFYNVTSLNSTSANQAPVEYYGVNQAFDTAVNLTETNASSYTTLVTPGIITNAEHGVTSTGIKLKAGVTKFRVYFWVEGQDVDTENNATGHNMSLNIELSID